MDEKNKDKLKIILNGLLYFIFSIWVILELMIKFKNKKYKNTTENLFIIGTILWILIGIIELNNIYNEYCLKYKN